MARARKAREKGFRERINEFLDFVVTTGPSGSMRVHSESALEEYRMLGEKSRQEREARERFREATPRPAEEEDLLSELVFRKTPRQEEGMRLRGSVTAGDLNASLELAEGMDSIPAEQDARGRRQQLRRVLDDWGVA